MLVVKHIWSRYNGGDTSYEMVHNVPWGDEDETEVTLTLYNTQTHVTEVLQFNSEERMLSAMRHLRPYGFVDLEMNGDPFSRIIAVDDMALNVLDIVDSVEYIEITAAMRNKFNPVVIAHCSFSSIDSMNTLFDGEIGEQFSCNLLNALTVCESIWIDDELYIPGMEGRDIDAETQSSMYKVNFHDKVVAKRFIQKARFLGDNPIRRELWG